MIHSVSIIHPQRFVFLFIGLCLMIPSLLSAQSYDLLLKDGHVIDPKNGIDGIFDIAISEGTIAAVQGEISEADAVK
ncbi:MAG: amidohydrolase/deacetylase family metallohydrolase, partial [Bacteroidetes bacterium]|nr:amidohydrolase/deacetylase family metallohydrolase [Bacteroidota bacterium]